MKRIHNLIYNLVVWIFVIVKIHQYTYQNYLPLGFICRIFNWVSGIFKRYSANTQTFHPICICSYQAKRHFSLNLLETKHFWLKTKSQFSKSDSVSSLLSLNNAHKHTSISLWLPNKETKKKTKNGRTKLGRHWL